MKKKISTFFILAIVAIFLSSCFYHRHREGEYRHNEHEEREHYNDHDRDHHRNHDNQR